MFQEGEFRNLLNEGKVCRTPPPQTTWNCHARGQSKQILHCPSQPAPHLRKALLEVVVQDVGAVG